MDERIEMQPRDKLMPRPRWHYNTACTLFDAYSRLASARFSTRDWPERTVLKRLYIERSEMRSSLGHWPPTSIPGRHPANVPSTNRQFLFLATLSFPPIVRVTVVFLLGHKAAGTGREVLLVTGHELSFQFFSVGASI